MKCTFLSLPADLSFPIIPSDPYKNKYWPAAVSHTSNNINKHHPKNGYPASRPLVV